MPSNMVYKSFNTIRVSGPILDNLLAALKDARSKLKEGIQSLDVYQRGSRQDLSLGKLMVIPASVCKDLSSLPKPLFQGFLARFSGDDPKAELEAFRLAESETDEPSKESLDLLKKQLFGDKSEPLIAFLPAWSNASDLILIQWMDDEEALKTSLRHLIFGVHVDPSLGSLFQGLGTSEDLVIEHLGNVAGLVGKFKSAATKKARVPVGSSETEDPSLEPEEEEVFNELGEQMFEESKEGSSKRATFMFAPGQVLKEFYPELNDGLLKYPAQNNSGMPPVNKDDSSTSAPSSRSLNPKPSMVQESVPLRRELQLRGPGAMDQFYRSVVNIPSGRLNMASMKEAAGSETEKEELLRIMQGVCGEIAALMLSGFKATGRVLAPGVPGEGVVDLSSGCEIDTNVGQILSVQESKGGLAGRIKSLIKKMNDSDLQEIVNSSWSQASVWNSDDKGGFTCEVLVRAESLDDETLKVKYKYVMNVK